MDWEESGVPKGDGASVKPAKKKRGKKGLIAILVVLLLLFIAGSGACSASKTKSEPAKLDWPKTGLAAMLPEPPSEYGTVDNYSNSLLAEFKGTSYDDYSAYVSGCKDLGFTEGVEENNTSYEAENSDGYSVRVWSSSDSVNVTLRAPSDSGNSKAEPPAAQEAETEGADEEESADAPDDSATSTTSSVREVMDEYEAFMDEYIAFMTKYKESSNPVSMAVDYAKMMKRYSDMTKKFDALEDDSMSDDDLAYYLEVQARVTKKLADASVS